MALNKTSSLLKISFIEDKYIHCCPSLTHFPCRLLKTYPRDATIVFIWRSVHGHTKAHEYCTFFWILMYFLMALYPFKIFKYLKFVNGCPVQWIEWQIRIQETTVQIPAQPWKHIGVCVAMVKWHLKYLSHFDNSVKASITQKQLGNG